MLVTGITKVEKVPHEPGQTITFRRLSWRSWEYAAEVKRTEAFAMVKSVSPEMLEAMRGKDSESKSKERDLEQFDTGTLLNKGIVAWSYEGEVTAQNIDLLDPQTAEWAVAQIMASRGTDRKNSASDSIAP